MAALPAPSPIRRSPALKAKGADARRQGKKELVSPSGEAPATAPVLRGLPPKSPQRFYSMSAQIRQERKAYYDVLETTQKGSLDHTPWMTWFLACLDRAIGEARATLAAVIEKARFWDAIAAEPINGRQRLMINRLLDGFEGKLTTSKWAALAKCSQDTALRDIIDLVQHGVLSRDAKRGRSTSYFSRLSDGGDGNLESWNLYRKLGALPGWRVLGKPL